jgi:hypothetical protein
MKVEIAKCAKKTVRFINTIEKRIESLNVAVAGGEFESVQW